MAKTKSKGSKETIPKEKLKYLEERIVDLEKKTKILDQFESAINKLAEQTDKMVTVSINLQAKMTELMIKVTDLTENVIEMVDVLKEAGELDMESSTEGATVSVEPIVSELKKMQQQNEETLKEIKNLLAYMKKSYTRELIGKAVRSNSEGAAGGYVI
jgi:hypothetical protein